MEQEKSIDEARSLSGLVEYQEDAVVSRTLIKKEKGTVTLFAFDQGQALSEHTVPHDALVYLLDGEAEIAISGKVHRLKEGETILLPGHEPHAVTATHRFKMVLTMIRS